MGSAAVPRRGRAVPLRTWWEDVRPFLHHQGLHQSRCSWGWRRPRAQAPERQRERSGVSTSPSSARTPGGTRRLRALVFALMLQSLFIQASNSFLHLVIQFAVAMSRVHESHSCVLEKGWVCCRAGDALRLKAEGREALTALRTLSQPLLFGHKKYILQTSFFLLCSETKFSSTSVPHTCVSYSQLPFYVFLLVTNYKSHVFIQKTIRPRKPVSSVPFICSTGLSKTSGHLAGFFIYCLESEPKQ